MPSGPTYYDFFGVRQNASAEQIRAAYLWLMKQHHPDRLDQIDRQRAADFAAILNRSYDVLKDPLKRARYDAWLARDVEKPSNARVRRALLTGETRRRREKKWDASSKAATALAAAVVCLIAAAVWVPGSSPFQQSEMISAGIASGHAAHIELGVSDADARTQARLAMRASPSEAERTSEHCFETARDSGSFSGTEMCIVFDDAYLEWNRTTGVGQPQPLYLNDSIMRLRHRDALAAIGSYEDSRLDNLRQLAVNAMLAEIKSEVNSDAAVSSAAATVAIRDNLSR